MPRSYNNFLSAAKKKFSQYSIIDVVKSAIYVSPLAIIRLLCGFLRSKLSAIIVGVEGVGLLGQANQFLLLVTTLGSLGMVTSFMQQMTRFRELKNTEKLNTLKGTVFLSQLSFMLVFIFAFLFAYLPVTSFFFNSTNSTFSYLILAIVILCPLNVIASNYLEGFFTAYHRYDLYVKASSIVTILSLIIFVPAVIFWKTDGGLFSIIGGEILNFSLFLYYVLRIEKIKNIFLFRFSKAIFTLTFRDGIINLLCSFLLLFCGMLIRQIVIKQTGEFKNGIYQFCLSITAYYTPFLTNLLWAKYFPIISAKGLTDETRQIIQNTLNFIIIVSSAIMVSILIFSEILIRILATSNFLSARQYLPVQFMGDFWYFLFYTYTIYLLAVRSVKKYLIITTIFLSSQYLLAKILVNYWSLIGVVAGYTLSSFAAGILVVYFFSKIITDKPSQFYLKVATAFIFVSTEAIFTIIGVNAVFKIILFVAWLYWFARPVLNKKTPITIT